MLPFPFGKLPAGTAPHMPVHFNYKAVLFKKGNELDGWHKTVYGMYPSDQSLCSHHLTFAVYNGLQIRSYLHSLHCLRKLRTQSLGFQHLLPYVSVIICHMGLIIFK